MRSEELIWCRECAFHHLPPEHHRASKPYMTRQEAIGLRDQTPEWCPVLKKEESHE